MTTPIAKDDEMKVPESQPTAGLQDRTRKDENSRTVQVLSHRLQLTPSQQKSEPYMTKEPRSLSKQRRQPKGRSKLKTSLRSPTRAKPPQDSSQGKKDPTSSPVRKKVCIGPERYPSSKTSRNSQMK